MTITFGSERKYTYFMGSIDALRAEVLKLFPALATYRSFAMSYIDSKNRVVNIETTVLSSLSLVAL